MNIRPDTLRTEIRQIRKILREIDERIVNLPGVEMPSDSENVHVFMIQLRGELELAAGRLVALSEAFDE